MQQYGFIFNLDSILDTREADRRAWEEITQGTDYDIDEEEVTLGSRSSGSLDGWVGRVLGEREPGEARRLGMGFFEARNRALGEEGLLDGLGVDEEFIKLMSR